MTMHAREAAFASPRRIFAAFAKAARPDDVFDVAGWAEARRYVAPESGSPAPGKWSNARTPYLVEIMRCLDSEHPARIVSVKLAAQLGKSALIENWIGYTIDADPAPMGLGLASLNEIQQWNQTRWTPFLDATPALKEKVFEQTDRSNKGSTTKFKAFRGGFLNIVSTSSAKELQARSWKRAAGDEISAWLAEVGDRGDPVDQFIARGDAHADFKCLLASTPSELPNCRITKRHEAGDQREFYVPCPECGEFQTIGIDRLHRTEPGFAAMSCAGCGVLIAETHKADMLQAGIWLKRYPSTDTDNPQPPAHFPEEDLEDWTELRGHRSPARGREPSFWLHQGYSPFKPWARLLDECDEAEKAGPEKKRAHAQQKLGLAWDPSVDAPDHAKLYEIRGRHVSRGRIPAWACMLTGAADVQNNRLEWAAYAWGPDGSGALVDWGIIEGDTLTDAPWIELAHVIGRRWPGEKTIPLGFDAFGIDSGGGVGRTAKVYQFVSKARGILALKGSSNPKDLPFSQGRKQKAKLSSGASVHARVDFIGGHGVKTTVMRMLDRSLFAFEAEERLNHGLYLPAEAPEEICRQLTAEIFVQPSSRKPGAIGQWQRLAGRANEHLDLAVYCYGLAWEQGLERWSLQEWASLMSKRGKLSDDAPLLDFANIEAGAASRNLDTPGERGASASPEKPAPAPTEEPAEGDGPPPEAAPEPQKEIIAERAPNPGAGGNPWAISSPSPFRRH